MRLRVDSAVQGGRTPRFSPWVCPGCRRVYWLEVGESLDRSLGEMLGEEHVSDGDDPDGCCHRSWGRDEGLGRERNPLVRHIQEIAERAFVAGTRSRVVESDGHGDF